MVARIWNRTGLILSWILVMNSASAAPFQIRKFSAVGNAYITESHLYVDSLCRSDLATVMAKGPEEYISFLQNSNLSPDLCYWIKFRLVNTSEINQIVLDVRPIFRTAELYWEESPGDIRQVSAGLDKPHKNWYIRHHTILLPLSEEALGGWYYLKVVSDYRVGMGLMLERYPPLIQRFNRENFANGWFYGIAFIAAFFSLIFFFVLGERAYLYYSLYVICFALFSLVDWNLIVKYLTYLPFKYRFDYYTIPFAGMTIFLLLYNRKLLLTKKHEPLADKFIIAAIWIRIVIYLAGAGFNLPKLHNPAIDNLLLAVAFVTAIIRFRQGYKPARYIVAGMSFLYLGLIIHSLQNVGVIPYNVLPLFSMYKTGVVEMIFFSLALAERFRIMKMEQDESHRNTIKVLRENSELQDKVIIQLNENQRLKDNLNVELEKQVKARTSELNEANRVISDINSFLEESNMKLAAEVKKISYSRIMQKEVSFEEFREIYPDEEQCYQYLDGLKWKNGFSCKKCGYNRCSDGNTPYSRRCSRCNYIERITSFTLFAHIKFPLNKAFYMLFLVNSGKNITIEELSEKLDLRPQTAWYFRKKLETAMKNASRSRLRNKEEGWSKWILEPKARGKKADSGK